MATDAEAAAENLPGGNLIFIFILKRVFSLSDYNFFESPFEVDFWVFLTCFSIFSFPTISI
jgi:hypothetical protein